jgi:hypothetical protein
MAKDTRGFKVAIFNKNEFQTIDFAIHAPRRVQTALMWRLHAPCIGLDQGSHSGRRGD